MSTVDVFAHMNKNERNDFMHFLALEEKGERLASESLDYCYLFCFYSYFVVDVIVIVS